jgi:hypothetical protein
VAGLCLSLGLVPLASSQAPPPNPPKELKLTTTMTRRATGTFNVKLSPQADDKPAGSTLGRMLIDKQFHGDLEAVSKGQMLAATTAVEGSAGYVAIEQVSGTLQGRRGTFVLQHSGTMDRGTPQLTITVVPDSGTDQLAGLTGKMDIQIADGKHSYVFEYSVPEPQ